jgi:hypothetical protein
MESNVPLARAVDLGVPKPASFIVQKLLIHKQRHAAKRAQDVLYIHDTLELFGASLDELQIVWTNEIRPKMSPKKAKEAVGTASDLFENVTDTIRNAARIPRDRNLQPENLRAAIQYGLNEVLGFASG